MNESFTAPAWRRPTHYCRTCCAMWMQHEEDKSWSLCSPSCGTCCDNVAMGEQIVALAAPAPSRDPPPRSRIEFRLSIGAESRKDLTWRLRELADEIDSEQLGPSSLWGGAGSHGDCTFSEDATIFVPEYRAAVDAWLKRQPARGGS